MAHLYDTTTTNNYSSSSSPAEPDDISRFLQQILLRSSSSSYCPLQQQCFAAPSSEHIVTGNPEPKMVPGPVRASVPDPASGLNLPAGGGFPATAVGNVSCCYSVGTLDNDPDECDYESEEAVEALVEEAVPKPARSRSSSKRSRAAEVHNLSEKRRRSRINEKMKALQNLIPNSNKTDKASMLDEAIEYLKQLQLQVQMLTMRNGLSLYPLCLPGMLQPSQIPQMRMDIHDGDKSLNENMQTATSMDKNISGDALLSLQDNCVKPAPVADLSTVIGSKASFETEPSIQGSFGPFQLSRSSNGTCPEKVLHGQPLNDDFCETSSAGKGCLARAIATPSLLFETQSSISEDEKLEASLVGDRLQSGLVNNLSFLGS